MGTVTAVTRAHPSVPEELPAAQQPFRRPRAQMAIQCQASNGDVGTYLYPHGGRIADAISPVLPGVLQLCLWMNANGWVREQDILGSSYSQTGMKITPELMTELRRRWRDRHVPGYWGTNAKAWIRRHLAYIRLGYPDGCTVRNAKIEHGAGLKSLPLLQSVKP